MTKWTEKHLEKFEGRIRDNFKGNPLGPFGILHLPDARPIVEFDTSDVIISQRIDIKPLSVNEAWKGRRFKTDKYKQYEKLLLLVMDKRPPIPEGRYALKILLGFSSSMADIDNPVKLIIDILQKKYKFNDKHIYELTIKKLDVNVGEEFIEYWMEVL